MDHIRIKYLRSNLCTHEPSKQLQAFLSNLLFSSATQVLLCSLQWYEIVGRFSFSFICVCACWKRRQFTNRVWQWAPQPRIMIVWLWLSTDDTVTFWMLALQKVHKLQQLHKDWLEATIGVNRPALGGTVPNLTAMSRCPAVLTFYLAFWVPL